MSSRRCSTTSGARLPPGSTASRDSAADRSGCRSTRAFADTVAGWEGRTTSADIFTDAAAHRRAFAVGSLIALAALLVASASWRGSEVGLAGNSLEASVARTPLAFEPDAGRHADRIDFLAHSVAGGSLYLSAGEAALVLPASRHETDTLRLGFAGGDRAVQPVALDPLPGRANSFIGDDPSQWRSGVPTFGRVRYESIYPGIDVDYYGNQRDLEYDLRIAPGADPERIAVELSGSDSLRITRGGDLRIDVRDMTVRQQAPVAYQEVAGERRTVDAAFELDGSTLSFDLGPYDRSRPLVIDPLVLGYSSYLGGGGFDGGDAIAVDSTGAAYVTGFTASADFPAQDTFPPGDSPGQDVFVTKLNPDSGGALTLAYSTYLGGNADDFGRGIAVDSAGAVYVTGGTLSTNYPTQDQLQSDPGDGTTDVFVTKLNPDSGGAVSLAYSTYIGGGGVDAAEGIAVDSDGEAYVTGFTTSTDYPTNAQFQTNQPGDDAFVTKLDADTGGVVTREYSTYLGGGSTDRGNGIGVQSTDGVTTPDAAFVIGSTESANFPTQDAFQADQPDRDVFVTRIILGFLASNITLPYSTYLGGGASENGIDIDVDSAGAAYVTGNTSSANFPTQDPLQGALSGPQDAFVAKLNPDSGGAATLAYSTYLGGSNFDNGSDVAIDSGGAAYVMGNTGSLDFPVPDAFQDQLHGTQDNFVAKLGPDSGAPPPLVYATYLGGAGSDSARGIAIDSSGSAYVTGQTDSTDFPGQDAFQPDQGQEDAYVAKLDLVPAQGGGGVDTDPPETTITKGPKKKTKKKKATFEFSSDEPGSSFQCSLDGRPFAPCSSPDKVKAKKKGKHEFDVRAVDAAGNADPTPATRTWKRKKKRK